MNTELTYQIGFFISTLLFVLSEYIGYSSCDSKGILEFCVKGYCITISKSTHDINTPHASEALISSLDEINNLNTV